MSRYSIVERLTNKKLSLLDESGRLDSEIERKEQELVTDKQEFKTWEATVQEEVKRTADSKQSEIIRQEADIKFLKEAKDNKETILKVKMGEIDKALIQLETISKAANE